MPTPPRPMSFKPGQASMTSLRTVVALRTSTASNPCSFRVLASSSWVTLAVLISWPAAAMSDLPKSDMPSFAKIFILRFSIEFFHDVDQYLNAFDGQGVVHRSAVAAQ